MSAERELEVGRVLVEVFQQIREVPVRNPAGQFSRDIKVRQTLVAQNPQAADDLFPFDKPLVHAGGIETGGEFRCLPLSGYDSLKWPHLEAQ